MRGLRKDGPMLLKNSSECFARKGGSAGVGEIPTCSTRARLAFSANRLNRGCLGVEFCQFPKVLGNRCQRKLVFHAQWASQPQTGETQNALQVREEHLDLLAPPHGCLVEGGWQINGT